MATPRVRLYHPDFGWGDVVRISADQCHLLVNFPGRLGQWLYLGTASNLSDTIKLEGAAGLRSLPVPKSQWGYCWNCNRLTQLKRWTSATAQVGWECPHCGGVSTTPHAVCREYGAKCANHPPVDPDGDPCLDISYLHVD